MVSIDDPDIEEPEIERVFQHKRNPKDRGGPGYNDEKDGMRGEQHGEELDAHAETRLRNSDGEFI